MVELVKNLVYITNLYPFCVAFINNGLCNYVTHDELFLCKYISTT